VRRHPCSFPASLDRVKGRAGVYPVDPIARFRRIEPSRRLPLRLPYGATNTLSVVSSRPRLAGWQWCLAIVVVAAAVRAIMVWGIEAPWIAPDEETYGLLGQSLWHSGTLTILGLQTSFYSLVYPAIAGLALDVFGRSDGIRALQIVQPLLMSTTGLVAYAWARRVTSVRWALVAAGLTIAVPALAYSGLMMSEVAYYPIVTLALLLTARAVEDPTLERQAFAGGAILIATLTRLQAFVLIPALVVAVLAFALFERQTRVIRRFVPAFVVMAVLAGGLLAAGEIGVGGRLFGAYTTTTDTSYPVGAALRWISMHAGDVLLLVAGAPLLATAVLLVAAVRGRESSPAARALLAISVSYALLSVIQVGVFASRFSPTLLERNLITVAPPLFVAFALWLDRGMPRPQPSTAIVCLLVVVPALTLRTTRLSSPSAAPSNMTARVFDHLGAALSDNWLEVIWIGGIILITAVFLLAPRGQPWILPAIVLVLLVGASVKATTDVRYLASDLRDDLNGDTDPRWVDQTVAAPVTYVHDGSAYWNGVWDRTYWNADIAKVAVLPELQSGSLPPGLVVSPRFDGQLFSTDGHRLDTPYVLASQRMSFVGTPVRSVTQPVDGTTLTLWKIDPPLRMRLLRTGILPNGDFSGHAQIDVFDCRPGELAVTLLGKDGSPATLTAVGGAARTAAPGPNKGARVTVPSPPNVVPGARCIFTLDTPGLVGTTVIAFQPSSG